MKPVYDTIEYKQGPYKGGLCSITIMPVRWLAEKWKPNFKTSIVDDISILPGYNTITINLIANSYNLQEKPKRSKAGSYYELSLAGTSNDIDYDTMQVLNTYRYEQWLVIFKDLQERTKIAGNLDAGFAFDFSNDENSNGGGEQRINLSFVLQQEDPALFFGKKVEDIVVTPKLNLPGSGNFDVSLNEDEDGLLVYFGTDTVYPSGTSFVLQRSTTPDFSSDVDDIALSGGDIAAGVYNDTTVEENVTYYYRMKATKAGYTDSDWAEDSDIVPATAALPQDDLWLDLDSEQGLTTSVVGPDTFVNKWTEQALGKEFNPYDVAHKTKVVNDVTLGTQVLTNEDDNLAWLAHTNVAEFCPDNASGMTIYIVARQSATGDQWGMFFAMGTNVYIRRNNNTNLLSARIRPNSPLTTVAALTNDTWYTIRLRFDGTMQYISFNNGAEESALVSSSFWTPGANIIFGNASNKRIARALVYRRNHSSTERDQVEDILKTKYGHY